MRALCAAALLLAAGCARCAGGSSFDAGLARVHRSADLRAALLTAYPEFRGARVVAGSAVLERELDREIPLEEPLLEVIRKNGFEIVLTGGKLKATREPFTLEIEGKVMRVGLPIVDSDVGKLLGTPSPLTSEQLATWFPKVEGAATLFEQFRLAFSYQATSSRAAYLVWQVVDLSTTGSWKVDTYPDAYELKRKPDGGGGGVPEEFTLRMVDRNTEASIELHRKGPLVDVLYVLNTEERR